MCKSPHKVPDKIYVLDKHFRTNFLTDTPHDILNKSLAFLSRLFLRFYLALFVFALVHNNVHGVIELCSPVVRGRGTFNGMQWTTAIRLDERCWPHQAAESGVHTLFSGPLESNHGTARLHRALSFLGVAQVMFACTICLPTSAAQELRNRRFAVSGNQAGLGLRAGRLTASGKHELEEVDKVVRLCPQHVVCLAQ
jgi:hypothetical protein